MKRLGIDIGSKTIKLVLLGEDGSVEYSTYQRHQSQVKMHLLSVLGDLVWRHGDCEAQVTVTGSAGMRVAELFDVPFVQEVVALKRAVTKAVPQADEILEMGGEDTKLVYLTGTPEQRMNTVCAGGTGTFIEMMANMMGAHPEDMNSLAMGATTIYPIASRCAVFAKSDVRPLLNAGARKADVAASVLEAVCTQAVAGLSAGRPLKGTVVLLGGPFQYIPAMRRAFCHVTGFDGKHVIVPENAHLFVATGAAESSEASAPVRLSALKDMVAKADFENEDGMPHLPALFKSRLDYEAFALRHAACRIPAKRIADAGPNLFLGIDAGSTTMKVALVDESGALVDSVYAWNQGEVTKSLSDMLQSVYAHCFGKWETERTLRRSCIIGYGEDLCKAGYGVDMSEVETVAHLRAARAIDPDVDFVMDIGGQDIKCFYVEDGQISDIVLNEACSSGCGSLFDSIARSCHKKKEEFARMALRAKSPVDLGTRCSTFIDSRVKHAQKDGVSPEDIAAGVSYSTVRNALYKVVRQPDFSKVGTHIIVQGGAFANDSILRAFELETGVEVKRPDHSELMGAWGAALLARDAWLAAGDRDAKSSIVDGDTIRNMKIGKKTRVCDQCANHCKLTLTRFYDRDDASEGWSSDNPVRMHKQRTQSRAVIQRGGRDKSRAHVAEHFYVSGNRCERGLLALGLEAGSEKKPPNMLKLKNALIEAADKEKPAADGPLSGSGVSVGVPRALALYESYPFWHAFFSALGAPVVPASQTTEDLYRKGMGSIPSEGACYPSKLVYGHAVDVAERGADVVFAPDMTEQFAREGLLGMDLSDAPRWRSCPLIEHMGTMLAQNVDGTVLAGKRIATPDLTAAEKLEDAAAPLAEALADAGLPVGEAAVRSALAAGRDAYRAFFGKLAAATERTMVRIDAGEFPGILAMAHGYHADPGINHGIDELMGTLGYAVLDELDYRFEERLAEAEAGGAEADYYFDNADALYGVRASAAHAGVQLALVRSFGCGVDALVADRAHDLIRADGRVYAELKVDQIIDLAAVRIRLRSMTYASRQRAQQPELPAVPPTYGIFLADVMHTGDIHRYLEGDSSAAPLIREACGEEALTDAGMERAREAARAAHPGEMDKMALLDYRLVCDKTQAPAFVGAFAFGYAVFHGRNDIALFTSWDEVRAYLDSRAADVEEERRFREYRERRRQERRAQRRVRDRSADAELERSHEKTMAALDVAEAAHAPAPTLGDLLPDNIPLRAPGVGADGSVDASVAGAAGGGFSVRSPFGGSGRTRVSVGWAQDGESLGSILPKDLPLRAPGQREGAQVDASEIGFEPVAINTRCGVTNTAMHERSTEGGRDPEAKRVGNYAEHLEDAGIRLKTMSAEVPSIHMGSFL